MGDNTAKRVMDIGSSKWRVIYYMAWRTGTGHLKDSVGAMKRNVERNGESINNYYYCFYYS